MSRILFDPTQIFRRTLTFLCNLVSVHIHLYANVTGTSRTENDVLFPVIRKTFFFSNFPFSSKDIFMWLIKYHGRKQINKTSS